MRLNDPRLQGLLHPLLVLTIPVSALVGGLSGHWWAGVLCLMTLGGGGIFVLLRRSR